MTQSKPAITRTTHTLPFERLSPLDFERLCLALLPNEGFENLQHYGAAGGDQGRDIVAHRGNELWYIQCKQVKECGPEVLLTEIRKIRGLIEQGPDLYPTGILFIVSCDVSAKARDRAVKCCGETSLMCEVWGRTDLDTHLHPHLNIIKQFFDLQTLLPGTPFQAPPLPGNFVPRPEACDKVKDFLLAVDPATPGILVVNAIHGLGGIGKTTLAAALAHDPAIQTRFPDGILWITLGQQPELLTRLHELISALGDQDFRAATVDGASAHLRTLLHDKTCLLVVDDAWQADPVRAFLVGGERCRVLITTRDATLARKVGAHIYGLDVMTEAQALALFEARLGSLDSNREQAAVLAHELGYLPLALELAAAQVEGGMTWAELVNAFRKELADLAALDLDEATYRNESLRLSFRLSLEQLSPEDQDAFAWLGVLPENPRLNQRMATTLWEQPEVDASKRLRRLRDKALLKPAGGDHYTVHDLLHDEAKLRLVERMPLPVARTILLQRYRARTRNGPWHTLPDDGYIHDHLLWHMEQAGWTNDVHTVLSEETAEGRNGWYEARERLGQTTGYLEDVRRARSVAVRSGTVCLQIRYALIESTIHSLAQELPIDLLIGLLQYGSALMPPAAVLDHVRQLPRVWQRADALHDLAPFLPEQVLPDALDMALAIARENERGLLGLAPFLTPDLLENTLHCLSDFVSEVNQARFIEVAISTMPERFLDLALATARQIQQADCRAVALSCLTYRLSGDLLDQVVSEALDVASQPCSYPPFRAQALMHLASRISSDQIEETWRSPWETDWETYRDECCMLLAQAHCRSGVIDRAFPLLRQSVIDQYRYQAITAIAPEMEENQLMRLLDYLPPSITRFERPRALGILARYGSDDLQSQVLDLARSDQFDELSRIIALATIAPHLRQPEAQKQVWEEIYETLQQSESERSYWDWSKWHLDVYQEVVDCLPNDLVSRIVQESQGTADWPDIALRSLSKLPEHLRQGACAELLAQARQGHFAWEMVSRLTPYISPVDREELFEIALHQAKGIGKGGQYDSLAPYRALASGVWGERPSRDYFREHDHVRVLMTMVAYSSRPEKMASLALQALDAIRPSYFEFSLREIVPLLRFLETDERMHLVERILWTVNLDSLRSEYLWETFNVVHTWHMLLANTSGESRRRAVDRILSLARETAVRDERMLLLSLVVDDLPKSDQQSALAEIVHWVREDRDAGMYNSQLPHIYRPGYLRSAAWVRSVVCAGIAHCMPPTEHITLTNRVLASVEANGTSDGPESALALAQVASSLPPEIAQPIFERVTSSVQREIRNWRSKSDHALLAWLPDDYKVRVLVALLHHVATIEDHKLRPDLLISLVTFWAQLPSRSVDRVLQEVLPLFAQGDRDQFLWDLQAIAPVVLKLGGETAVESVIDEVQRIMSWWP